jgi:hypothetical protein
MYIILLQIGEDLVGSIAFEEALEVIGETCWEGQLEFITVQRDRLYNLFHMDSTVTQRLTVPMDKGSGKKVAAIDENDNYASLVDAAGY